MNDHLTEKVLGGGIRLKRVGFILCSLFLLTGCWDKQEIKKLGFVLAIGIDKGPKGDILVTAQVVNPEVAQGEGSIEKSSVKLVGNKGKTVFQAIRKMLQEFDRKNHYAHNKVIVISEDLAKEGLLPILDSLKRGGEVRGYVWLCIAKGVKAREVLGVKPEGVETIQANYLKGIIENQQFNYSSANVTILEFYKKVLGTGIYPVAGSFQMIRKNMYPVEENSKTKTDYIKLSGGAVFRKDMLVGYLNETETHGYNWIAGKVKSGIIVLPSLIEKGKSASIEVIKASAKIKPVLKENRISFIIDIHEKAVIVEEQGRGQLKSSQERFRYFRNMEKENEKLVRKEVMQAVNKAKRLRSDFLGLGSALNKKYPAKWNETKKEWDAQLSDIQVIVKVDVTIRGAREMKGPF